MEKLELKHIAPYLPYGVKAIYQDDVCYINGIYLDGSIFVVTSDGGEYTNLTQIKPILRPLSDLTIEIYNDLSESYPNTPNWDMYHKIWYTSKIPLHETIIEYCVFEKLTEWHFDVFGLIDKGLAIDINTLNNG